SPIPPGRRGVPSVSKRRTLPSAAANISIGPLTKMCMFSRPATFDAISLIYTNGLPSVAACRTFCASRSISTALGVRMMGLCCDCWEAAAAAAA
ncbi:hypothetical protein PFISCL1PPCAC_8569, partial [Pristionchus fissidentatus]